MKSDQVLEHGGVDDDERDFDAASDCLVLSVVGQRKIGGIVIRDKYRSRAGELLCLPNNV